MFLSRIELDTKRDRTLRAIVTPTVIHAAVEGCFPRRDEGNERKLWRIDALDGRLYLLLLSPERPDFKGFAEQFSPQGSSGEMRDYMPLLNRISQGQRWRFRLCANAVHSVVTEKGKRGKPYAHTTAAHKREWLQARAEKNGFSLAEHSFDVVQSGIAQFRRGGRSGTQVTIGGALYEGELTVTDADLLRQSMTNGIGRAKAYGCGLLTLQRS